MKTKIIIEIESEDSYIILDPETDKRIEDPLEEKLFAQGLHKSVIDCVKKLIEEDMEDHWHDWGFADEYVNEYSDSFGSYGIKVKLYEKKIFDTEEG